MELSASITWRIENVTYNYRIKFFNTLTLGAPIVWTLRTTPNLYHSVDKETWAKIWSYKQLPLYDHGDPLIIM